MRLIESLKKRKLVLLNIFLTLYIGINLIGGERGLLSYFEKKDLHQELIKEEHILNNQLDNLNKKILLIEKNDVDFIDMVYREKLKYGTENEILIKLK